MTNTNLPPGPLIADIAGLYPSAAECELLSSPSIGGVILFSRNFQDQAQLAALVEQLRALRPNLIIAVDHEGGRVQRFRHEFTPIPPMQRLGSLYAEQPAQGLEAAREIGWLLAAELLAFDIDISFAPVLDVDDNLSEIIGDRSFSADANCVVKLASAFIDGMHDAGMAVTGKHFPGHGGIRADSHLELPIDERELGALELRDLLPFSVLVSKLDAIMPAHILFPRVDDKAVGFSNWWIQEYLRAQLGFTGVVFSDDLSMAGAEIAGDWGSRARAALTAGCDAILVCNHPEGVTAVLDALGAQPPASQNRLATMKGTRHLGWQELKCHPRWRKARQLIENLHKS